MQVVFTIQERFSVADRVSAADCFLSYAGMQAFSDDCE